MVEEEERREFGGGGRFLVPCDDGMRLDGGGRDVNRPGDWAQRGLAVDLQWTWTREPGRGTESQRVRGPLVGALK